VLNQLMNKSCQHVVVIGFVMPAASADQIKSMSVS
jgi:hypothetical protein